MEDQLSLEPYNYPIATKLLRLINYLVDSIAVALLTYGIKSLIKLEEPLINTVTDILANKDLLLINFAVNALVLFIYYFTTELTEGRTFGKLLTGTKVVQTNGDRCTLVQIFLRTLSRFIPFNVLSFLFYTNTGWHDILSKTKVVIIGKPLGM
jgi:uncharacterized RDD family membrane protein YckC